MENIIEINGREYTEDEIREKVEYVVEMFKKAWNKIVDMVEKLVKAIARIYVEYVFNHTPVGLKRYFKIDKLKYYQSISKGKSNNWRKSHGLPLKRRL